MCGILCLISADHFDVKGFSPLQSKSSSAVGTYQSWELSDVSTIKKDFIDLDLATGDILTPSDLAKLENLDNLRELAIQLSKIKNNVKVSKDLKMSQIEEITKKMSELTGEEQESATSLKQSPEPLSDSIKFSSLVNKIASRGPDYLSYNSFAHSEFYFHLFSSVLSLRQPFQEQPIRAGQYVLQFNGELYNSECLDNNDTQFILNKLDACNGDVLSCICQLIGEFAFVIHDLKQNLIYFGRDCVGKRSLSYCITNKSICISSVPLSEFIDCQNKIYVFDLALHSLRNHSYSELFEKYNRTELKFSPPKWNSSSEQDVPKLREMLSQSVSVRQTSIHPLHPDESAFGVLFSGGLDCTLVAAILCENIAQVQDHVQFEHHTINIDLLTVGFDNPRTNQSSADSPDRKLAKKSWQGLAEKYNLDRIKLRLVEIDVPYSMWLSHKTRVLDLIYPHDTEMDLSIGIAFYFASSRIPEITSITTSLDGVSKPGYVSGSKVLFSGLGADELFAGYSRHESIFTNNLTVDSSPAEIDSCYTLLTAELINDIDIIHTRNLSRDDRVISSWGKELRYPYLDERFISYVFNTIGPQFKFNYHFEKVATKKNKEGTLKMKPIRKYLLRELAGEMGLEWVKHEAKRAIQFGAKSAKMEIGQSNVKGTDRLAQ